MPQSQQGQSTSAACPGLDPHIASEANTALTSNGIENTSEGHPDLWAIFQGPPAPKRLSAKERGYDRPRPYDIESAGLSTYDNNVVDYEAEEPYRQARESWVTS